jgi:hypothetical protein
VGTNIFTSTNANNAFVTNVILGLDVWTNQNGQFVYLNGQGPVTNGGPGPGFFFRPDGSLFVGTNAPKDTVPTIAGIWSPYVITMTASNEPTTVHAGWTATDSQAYGQYAFIDLTAQQAGFGTLRVVGQASATDGRSIYLNAHPGTTPIQYVSNSITPFLIQEDGRPQFTYSAGLGKVLVSDAQGLGTWTTIGLGVGPGTNNFLAKFDSTTTNVQGSILYSDTSNNIEARQSFNPSISYTNSATNRIGYGEWTNAGTNQWLEIVVPKGHNNEFAHIRHMAIGQTNQRSAIIINDAIYVFAITNQGSGNPSGGIIPLTGSLGTGLQTLGTFNSPFQDVVATRMHGTTGLSSGPQFGSGVGGTGFGLTTDNSMLQFFRDTGITAAFNKTAGQFVFDVAGNYIGFGTGISNCLAWAGNSAIAGLIQIGTNSAVAAPLAQGIMAAQGSGTDKGGSDLRVAGGPSTGAGKPGDIIWQTANPAASSSSLNAFVDRMKLTTNALTIYSNLVVSGNQTNAGAFQVNSNTLVVKSSGAASSELDLGGTANGVIQFQNSAGPNYSYQLQGDSTGSGGPMKFTMGSGALLVWKTTVAAQNGSTVLGIGTNSLTGGLEVNNGTAGSLTNLTANIFCTKTNYVASNFVPIPGYVFIASSNGVLYKVTQLSTNLLSSTVP